VTTPVDPTREKGAILEVILLAVAPMDSPFWRRLEYRAYAELVAVLSAANALPPNYKILAPQLSALQDWIHSGTGIGRRFKDEIRKLLFGLRTSGSDVLDRLCTIYCRFKEAIALGIDAAGLLLQLKGAAVIVAAGGGFLFLGAGLPITSLVAYLLRTKVLDKLCRCQPIPQKSAKAPRKAKPPMKPRGRQGT
jgi:hypothetical protein